MTFAIGASWSARFAPDGRSIYYSTSIGGAGDDRIVRAELAVPSRTELGIAGRLVGVSSTGELALIPQRMSDTPAVLERVFPGAGGPRAVADHVVDGCSVPRTS